MIPWVRLRSHWCRRMSQTGNKRQPNDIHVNIWQLLVPSPIPGILLLLLYSYPGGTYLRTYSPAPIKNKNTFISGNVMNTKPRGQVPRTTVAAGSSQLADRRYDERQPGREADRYTGRQTGTHSHGQADLPRVHRLAVAYES